jgi:hypothetical protein
LEGELKERLVRSLKKQIAKATREDRAFAGWKIYKGEEENIDVIHGTF